MSNAAGESELGKASDVVDAELLHHRFAITANGLKPEVQQDGDLLAGFALSDKAKNLKLAGGEDVEGGRKGLRFEVAALDSLEQTIGDLRAEIRAAFGNSAEGIDEVAVGGFFEDEGARAGADSADDRVLVVVHGKNDDLDGGVMAQDLGSGLDAIEAGEADIHENDIGAPGLADLNGIGARFGLRHDLKLFAVSQDGLDAIAHNFVVVNQKDV